MSRALISRSDDLRALRDDGYDVAIVAGHLVVREVPHVNSGRQVAFGALVSELTLAGDVTAKPSTHVVHFAGEYPCHSNGNPIEALRHGSGRNDLGGGLVVDHSFSNRPAAGYSDYYEKMTRYIQIISSEAAAVDPSATPRRYPVVSSENDDTSPFHYLDTASSRAGIYALSERLGRLRKVAIIGLGGTGAYVLDLVAKTPIAELHLFDGDHMLSHNAFRSPGALSLDDLRGRPAKVEYFAAVYRRLRKGIVTHPVFIDEETVVVLQQMEFAFICVDAGPGKRLAMAKLQEWSIPFIDVGMGINLTADSLGGVVRTTTFTPGKADHLARVVSLEHAGENNDYDQNIQVADLNALNATLAVIKWKKLYGFYRDLGGESNSLFITDTHTLLNE